MKFTRFHLRISVFLLLLPVISLSLQAARPFIPGVKLGFGQATVFGQDTFEQKWQTGWGVGISLEYFIIGPLSLQAELNFSRKGSTYRLNSDGLEYSEKYILDYLEIPVLARFYLRRNLMPEIYFYAGPSAAFNLKARLKVSLDDLEETVEVDNLRGMDFLLNAGAGLSFPVKPVAIILEARYSRGLKSVVTEPEADLRNKSFLALVGFKF